MRQASARALVWRARHRRGWANVWRWVLLAAAAALSAYFLLDRGMQNGVFTAGAIALLVIGAAVTLQQADGDRADGDACPVHRRARRASAGGSSRSRTSPRRRVRNRRAPRHRPVQSADAAAAVAEPLLPVRHAVHGHRQPVRGEHLRVVPRVAARLRCADRRLGTRPCGLRAARAAPHRRHLLRHRGRHHAHRAAPIRVGRLQRRCIRPAAADAQELRGNGDGVRRGGGLRQSRLDLVVEEFGAPRLLAAAGRDRHDPVAPSAHRPHLRDRAGRCSAAAAADTRASSCS